VSAALSDSGNGAGAPRILGRALLLVFYISFGSLTGFYLLLSTVPLYAASVGAGGVGAGFATGALMLATVAAELATPRLVARFGYRLVLAAGVLLLGAPALVLPATTRLAAIFAISLVRGGGLAIVVVVAGALVASLVPHQRRGEGLGIYGAVVGVPAVLALPLGVWLVGHAGYATVFISGGVAALSGLAAVPALPVRAPRADRPLGIGAGLRAPTLVRPALVFSTTAMAAGAAVTFLPLAVAGSGNLAAAGLLAQAVAGTLSRWWAGRHGDLHGQVGLLLTGVLVTAAGTLGLALTGSPAAVVTAMVLLGAGFGVAQNASLALMLDRVSPAGYETVSALWNLAYDAGLGVGAAGFGVLATQTGYPAAFACTALVMLLLLAPARLRRGWLVPTDDDPGLAEG
jgi:MFS family permease